MSKLHKKQYGHDLLPIHLSVSEIKSMNYLQGGQFIDEETALQEFFRHGQRQLPAELRNAKYPITLRIDLHQHTKTSALRRLEQLLENSSPAAVLLIIHGQGLGFHLH